MKVLIYGIKSTAKIISEILIEDHNFKVAGFIGSDQENKKSYNKRIFNNLYFLGAFKNVKKIVKKDPEIVGFILGTSNLRIKEEIYYNFEKLNLHPINAISKKSDISPHAKIGKGVVVGKNSIILAEAEIANNVYIGSNSTIENSVIISNNSSVGSNCVIGSNVEIGRGVKISAGAKILSQVRIGKNQFVKLGQVVDKDLPDKTRS